MLKNFFFFTFKRCLNLIEQPSLTIVSLTSSFFAFEILFFIYPQLSCINYIFLLILTDAIEHSIDFPIFPNI
jgi:hypothetical protein